MDIDITGPGIARTVEWAIARVSLEASQREDARQHVLLEIWKAAARFDASKGILFRTFAAARALGAVRDFRRGMDGVSRRHPPAELCSIEYWGEGLRCKAAGPEARAVARVTADQLMRCLNPREHYAVAQHWLLERSLVEVGCEMGISPQRVMGLCSEAMRKMRKAA